MCINKNIYMRLGFQITSSSNQPVVAEMTKGIKKIKNLQLKSPLYTYHSAKSNIF
jgi:hypothetical protein